MLKKVIALTVAIMGLFLIPLPVHALAPPQPSKSSGLSVSPLRTELSSTPGTSQSGSLTLTNSSTAPMTVHMSAEKFSVIDKQYNYAFTPVSDAAKWVQFKQDEIVLDPGQAYKLSYRIGVPLDAEPGGQYLSLFAETDAISSNDQVKSRQRVASLIYLTVSGDISRVGNVVSLTAPAVIAEPTKWSMELQNSGTAHYRSDYSIELQGVFGNTVVLARDSALVLPRTIRSVEGTFPAPRLPGIYRAVFTASLGDQPTYHQSKYVVYVPLWSVAALLVAGCMVATGVLYLRSLRKS